MKVIGLEEIERTLRRIDLTSAIEEAFMAYSGGGAVVPPVGELLFDDPPGEVHIKYGYLRGDEYYVIKVASGFYENPALGLPSGDGLMLLFEQATGRPVAALLDHARLTDVRTAVAGSVVAKLLAPPKVERIGIFGTGVQARLQLVHLRHVTPCRRVLAWGRNATARQVYQRDMEAEGFEVDVTADAGAIGPACDLIVTATPSTTPLLRATDVRPGSHITAVGSDTVGKQELEAEVLARADLVVADSLSQCRERGEIAHALRQGQVSEESVVEIGDLLSGRAETRSSEAQITVADLTGLAVQDVQAAKAVFEAVTAHRQPTEGQPTEGDENG